MVGWMDGYGVFMQNSNSHQEQTPKLISLSHSFSSLLGSPSIFLALQAAGGSFFSWGRCLDSVPGPALGGEKAQLWVTRPEALQGGC